MKKTNVPVYMTICSHNCKNQSKREVTLFGCTFSGDFSGQVEAPIQIRDDVLYLDLPELGYNVQLGNVAHMTAVALRFCDDDISVQGIYDDPAITAFAACCRNDDNSCRCYASESCVC